MFEVFCPAHQARVLLSTGRIEAVRNTPDGVLVEWRCWCDHRGRSIGGRSIGGRTPPEARRLAGRGGLPEAS